MSSPLSIQKKVYRILDRFGVLLAGIFIFAYYLWAAMDMFSTSHERRGFQGYFFQFDSLIMLWLLLLVGVKLYDYKKKRMQEEENNRNIVLQYERQKMQIDLLEEVTRLLTDAVNNPLSVISLSAGSIRERFAADSDITSFLDRIDGALKRVNEVLHGFQSYQTKKILSSPQASQPEQHTLSIDPSGEIRRP